MKWVKHFVGARTYQVKQVQSSLGIWREERREESCKKIFGLKPFGPIKHSIIFDIS